MSSDESSYKLKFDLLCVKYLLLHEKVLISLAFGMDL